MKVVVGNCLGLRLVACSHEVSVIHIYSVSAPLTVASSHMDATLAYAGSQDNSVLISDLYLAVGYDYGIPPT